MKCSIARLVTILVLSTPLYADVMEFHAAPGGLDDHPGTVDKPFATLGKAQQVVQQEVSRGLARDITVWIHEGTYDLTETIVFRPDDGGTQQFAVIYAAHPGEQAVISGGRRITGWQRGEGEVWETVVPEAKEDKWRFRNLFVGGQRAIRARSPNQDEEPNCWKLKDVEWSGDQTRYALILPHGCLGD